MKNKKIVHKKIEEKDNDRFFVLNMAGVIRWFGLGAVEDLRRQGYLMSRAEIKRNI